MSLNVDNNSGQSKAVTRSGRQPRYGAGLCPRCGHPSGKTATGRQRERCADCERERQGLYAAPSKYTEGRRAFRMTSKERAEIYRLLDEGALSHREIARHVGRSYGIVGHCARKRAGAAR